jgi:hypothetical protein
MRWCVDGSVDALRSPSSPRMDGSAPALTPSVRSGRAHASNADLQICELDVKEMSAASRRDMGTQTCAASTPSDEAND